MSCVAIYLYGKHAFIREMRSTAPFATYRIDIKFSQHVRFISTRNKFFKKYFFSVFFSFRFSFFSLIFPWMDFQLDQNWLFTVCFFFKTASCATFCIVITIIWNFLTYFPCEFRFFFNAYDANFDFNAAVTIAQHWISFEIKIFRRKIK